MPVDRTTKLLLGLIAAGLWANLLLPLFKPQPTTAQALITPVRIVEVDGILPVGIARQSAPLEVKNPQGVPLKVETTK